jgi:hypothetical protein
LFYITAATEIQDRLPIQNDFFLNLRFLDPHIAFNQKLRSDSGVNIDEIAFHFKNHINLTDKSVEWQRLTTSFNKHEITDFQRMSVH